MCGNGWLKLNMPIQNITAYWNPFTVKTGLANKGKHYYCKQEGLTYGECSASYATSPAILWSDFFYNDQLLITTTMMMMHDRNKHLNPILGIVPVTCAA